MQGCFGQTTPAAQQYPTQTMWISVLMLSFAADICFLCAPVCSLVQDSISPGYLATPEWVCNAKLIINTTEWFNRNLCQQAFKEDLGGKDSDSYAMLKSWQEALHQI